MKKDFPEQTQAQTSYNRGPKREFSCYNCDKGGHLAPRGQDCWLPKKNRERTAPMTEEKLKKMLQDMMVQCNKKVGYFY